MYHGAPDGDEAHRQAVREVEAHGRPRAADDLHTMVLRSVEHSRPEQVPHEAVRQYRQETQRGAITRQVANQDRATLLNRLRGWNVHQIEAADWVSWQDLRAAYISERTRELAGSGLADSDARAIAKAEVETVPGGSGLTGTAKGTQSQFNYLAGRNALPSIDHLDLTHAKIAAVETALNQPLTATEHRQLIRTVTKWDWAHEMGEMFPALVAHTLNIRLHYVGDDTRNVGPLSGHTGTAHIFYNGANHYEASTAGTRHSAPPPPQPKPAAETGTTHSSASPVHEIPPPPGEKAGNSPLDVSQIGGRSESDTANDLGGVKDSASESLSKRPAASAVPALGLPVAKSFGTEDTIIETKPVPATIHREPADSMQQHESRYPLTTQESGPPAAKLTPEPRAAQPKLKATDTRTTTDDPRMTFAPPGEIPPARSASGGHYR
jgi:hypothetical protein